MSMNNSDLLVKLLCGQFEAYVAHFLELLHNQQPSNRQLFGAFATTDLAQLNHPFLGLGASSNAPFRYFQPCPFTAGAIPPTSAILLAPSVLHTTANDASSVTPTSAETLTANSHTTELLLKQSKQRAHEHGRGDSTLERMQAEAFSPRFNNGKVYEHQSGSTSPPTVSFSISDLLEANENGRNSNVVHGQSAEIKRKYAGAVHNLYTAEDLQTSDGRCKRRKQHLAAHNVTPVFKGRAIPQISSSVHKHRCNECGKSYATSSNLSRHKQTHRPLSSPYAKKCLYCERIYVSMPALSMHLLTHQASHKCQICGKLFSRPWLLKGHMRAHTGQRPFGCASCGKAFSDRSNLRAHLNTHVNNRLADKHYECPACGKCFTSKAQLNRHSTQGEGGCLPSMCRQPSTEDATFEV